MARYTIYSEGTEPDDLGVIVDTEKAAQKWEEDTFWNGNNHISKATGDQWTHQTLYRSAKGRYYIEYHSQWQGSVDHAEFIDEERAAFWLIQNSHELPAELEQYADQFCE